MTATFISGFSKRRNSTKRPTGGTSKTVVLKDNTSLMKPAFLLSTVTWSWNYCVWNGNYYWITDIVQEANALFRVECEIDVLATFKVSIGNYSTLISRAASDQNYDVIDTIYPAKTGPITKQSVISAPGIFTADRSAGCVVMGTIGYNGQRVYVMNPATFASMCALLFPRVGSTDLATWVSTEITQAVAGGLNNIVDNITFLKWLPISSSSISSLLTSVNTIYIGNWEVSALAYELQGTTITQLLGTLVSFPARDDAGARGKWLYQSPFAEYSIYIPPFGMISLDGSYMISAGRQVTVDILINVMTGNLTLRLFYSLGNSAPKMIGVYSANVGFDMKAGGAAYNVGGMMSGIAGTLSAAINKDAAGVIGGIASAATAALPGGSQIGGGVSGPAPDIASNWVAYATYYDPIDENQSEFGRPLAEVKTISTLSGYVQCANASLTMPGHEIEMIKVNEFLNNGFFYE